MFNIVDKGSTQNISDKIKKTAKLAQSKEAKHCKTCDKILPLEKFKDNSLKTKYRQDIQEYTLKVNNFPQWQKNRIIEKSFFSVFELCCQ